jgi:hypothetical protein
MPTTLSVNRGQLHSNRFFLTFGAEQRQKSAAINNLHDLSNQPFGFSGRDAKVLSGIG